MQRIMPSGLVLLAWLAVAAGGAGGCNPIAVNVPPLPGDTAFHSPNAGSVVDIEAEALKHVLKKYPTPGAYAIDLPHGTSEDTYAEILSRLPENGAVAGRTGAAGSPTYRVVQVRVRRNTALADVVVPGEATEQLVTVTVVKDVLTPWYARSSRVWRIPVEEAMRMSGGSIPPPGEPAEPSDEPAPAPAPESSPAPETAPESAPE